MEFVQDVLIIILVLLVFLLVIIRYNKKRKLLDTSNYRKIDIKQMKELIENRSDLLILDVRTKKEYDVKNIPNSILIESTVLKKEIEQVVEDKNIPIIVYCESGGRSRASAMTLLFLGYKEVYDFGSIYNWE